MRTPRASQRESGLLLDGYVVLARRLDSPRFRRIEEYPARNVLHAFRLHGPADVDAEVRAWLAEAYGVGRQEHLRQNRGMTDYRALHRRAFEVASGYVASVEDEALVRPTPCVGWDLRDLLAHMVGQHHGFAAAVTDGDAPASAYAWRDVSEWASSVDVLLAAFAAADLDRSVRLVEISADRRFPAGFAVGFQLLDTVIHTWDVATALGVSFVPDAELTSATLALAKLVPQGENRLAPGAAFAPAVEAPANDDWAQALALTGRR